MITIEQANRYLDEISADVLTAKDDLAAGKLEDSLGMIEESLHKLGRVEVFVNDLECESAKKGGAG